MILVVGGTGTLGEAICQRLRARGLAVRALGWQTAKPARLPAVRGAGGNPRSDLLLEEPERWERRSARGFAHAGWRCARWFGRPPTQRVSRRCAARGSTSAGAI